MEILLGAKMAVGEKGLIGCRYVGRIVLPLCALFVMFVSACSESGGVTDPGSAPPASMAAGGRLAGSQYYWGEAGEAVPVAALPQVIVKDAAGSPVAGVSIRFELLAGGGSMVSDVSVTDRKGIATSPAWTLGQRAGDSSQILRAAPVGAALSGSPVVFTYSTRAGAPSALRVLSGSGLLVRPNRPVIVAPSVLLLDRFGNPAPGSVTFSVTSGGGSIGQSVSEVVSAGATGVAALSGWKAGPAPGLQSLSVSLNNKPDVSALVSVTSAHDFDLPFGIDVRFAYLPSSEEVENWKDVVLAFRQVITSAHAERRLQLPAGRCFPGSPAIDTVSGGVVVFVHRDPSLSSSAAGGPCSTGPSANGRQVTEVGRIVSRSGDLPLFTIAHELEHVLGVGTGGWASFVVSSGAGYVYTGPGALEEMARIAGDRFAGGIPLLDPYHWDSKAVPNDFVNPTGPFQVLTTVSLGAMKDLGYSVDLSRGASFVLPGTVLPFR